MGVVGHLPWGTTVTSVRGVRKACNRAGLWVGSLGDSQKKLALDEALSERGVRSTVGYLSKLS